MSTAAFEILEDTVTPSALPPFTDMSNLWDMADEEVPHLFDNAMALGEAAVVCSEPGVGKTTLVIGLALSVAFGKTLIPGFTPLQQGPVLLLLGEDAGIPTAHRVRAWCQAHGVTREECEAAVSDGRLTFMCGESENLLQFTPSAIVPTPACAEVLTLCESKQYKMVVVDSLIQWTGITDENANGAMHAVGLTLINIAKATGGVALALAHTNKQADRTGTIGLHSIRGGGALAGKIRWGAQLLHLTDKECNKFKLQQSDRRKYVKLVRLKNQYGWLDPTPVHLERGDSGVLDVVQLNGQDDNSLLSAIVAELKERPISLTCREMYKSKGAISVEFRDRVSRRAGGANTGWRAMQDAIDAGLMSGALIKTPHPDTPEREQVQAA